MREDGAGVLPRSADRTSRHGGLIGGQQQYGKPCALSQALHQLHLYAAFGDAKVVGALRTSEPRHHLERNE